MRLIVGLGNPGKRYYFTRHNIGFLTLERVAERHGIRLKRNDTYRALVGKGGFYDCRVMLMFPLTFMNLSGEAVEPAFRKEIRHTQRMLVISDDINLELGRIRLKPNGSSGGHKGLASIIDCLKTRNFPRLRMGIATAKHKGDIGDYVLDPFRKKDTKAVAAMIDDAQEAVALWVRQGIDAAMNQCNS